jgi:hypothetical protein
MLLAQAVEMWLWGSLQGYTGDPPLGAIGECTAVAQLQS